jgi:hypothetical protein
VLFNTLFILCVCDKWSPLSERAQCGGLRTVLNRVLLCILTHIVEMVV